MNEIIAFLSCCLPTQSHVGGSIGTSSSIVNCILEMLSSVLVNACLVFKSYVICTLSTLPVYYCIATVYLNLIPRV